MPLVFISYRRRDTGCSMPGLYFALKQRISPDEIFVDERDIPPGADFPAALELAVAESSALLALIGPLWIDLIADTEVDYVVLEIGGALEAGALVFPVLFHGAPMPGAGELPGRLEAFATRNAWPITRERSLRDLDDLAENVATQLGVQVAAVAPAPGVQSANLVTGVAVALLLALIAVVVL
jgi:hypothetical protein